MLSAEFQSPRTLQASHSPSQTLRDVTADRYRNLRRPKRVVFFRNGERFFDGLHLRITPHRYLDFSHLLTDLTNKIPTYLNLPNGVRNIYTPVGGHRITDLEDLKDKGQYVCAGTESFQAVPYGVYEGGELHCNITNEKEEIQ